MKSPNVRLLSVDQCANSVLVLPKTPANMDREDERGTFFCRFLLVVDGSDWVVTKLEINFELAQPIAARPRLPVRRGARRGAGRSIG